MKRLIGRLFGLIATVCVLGIIAALVWHDYAIRKSIEYGVVQVTGFPLQIESIETNFKEHNVHVKDIRLNNPPEFREPLFTHLPELGVDYDLSSFWSGTPHLNELVVNIEQLNIVKDERGQTNVSRLKGVSPTDEKKPKAKYKIDKFHLKVAKVTMKDYSVNPPSERNLPADIDVTFRDLSDGTDINRLVLITLMSKLPLPDIGVGLANLTDGISKNVIAPAGMILKDTGMIVGSVVSGSTNVIQQTGSKVMKGIGNLFK